MKSFLRQLVASPRKGHSEAGLDLCYVTDHIIATSGPSHTYPRRAYRNPLDQLVAFLDSKHGADWAIWEFRAEGTGYPDHLVYDRICHFPFPDHHPPPFRLVPVMLASMRSWLHGGPLLHSEGAGATSGAVGDVSDARNEKRVVVVHCKAGKGRSGTASASYLIAEEGWSAEDALARFTERRMRPRFGAGVSIPSQLRWVRYVDRWTRHGKAPYQDAAVEIVEVHVWGLRAGVKVDVEGFVDEGTRILSFHTFERDERFIVEAGDAQTTTNDETTKTTTTSEGGVTGFVQGLAGIVPDDTKAPLEETEMGQPSSGKGNEQKTGSRHPDGDGHMATTKTETSPMIPEKLTQDGISKSSALYSQSSSSTSPTAAAAGLDPKKNVAAIEPGPEPELETETEAETENEIEPGGRAVIFRPRVPVRIPNSDVNISVERRNRTRKSILGLTMVSSVAHVWFNAFFEGNGPEQGGVPDDSGLFDISWEAMDGIKGTSRKGSRALDRISVVWRFAAISGGDVGHRNSGSGGKQETESTTATDTAAQKVAAAADFKDAAPVSATPTAADAGAVSSPTERERVLGLRVQSPASADISRASSVASDEADGVSASTASVLDAVKTSDPSGAELSAS